MRRSDKKAIRNHEKKVTWAKAELRKIMEDDRRKLFPIFCKTQQVIQCKLGDRYFSFAKNNHMVVLDLTVDLACNLPEEKWIHIYFLTPRGVTKWQTRVLDAKDFWLKFETVFQPIAG